MSGVARVYILCEEETKPWLFGSLCEVLSSDSQIPHGKEVVGDEAFYGPEAILDGERAAVDFVGRRRGGVIFGVEKTRGGGALGAGNPEITGAKHSPASHIYSLK